MAKSPAPYGLIFSIQYINPGVGVQTLSTATIAPDTAQASLPSVGQFQFSGGMFGPSRTRGEVQVSSGVLEIENGSGFYDDSWTYSFDGQQIVWSPMSLNGSANLTQFGIGSPVYVETGQLDWSHLQLFLRDALYDLRNPFLPIKYGGTNVLPAGIDGTEDIAGDRKPRVIGRAFNISPVCVNTVKQIYNVDGQKGLSAGWTLTVYDMRVPLVQGAVYVNQADMEANPPRVNQFRVHPASGCFRLGSKPIGRITCDVLNKATLPAESATPAIVTGCESHVVAHRVLRDVNLAYVDGVVSECSANPDVGVLFTGDITGVGALNAVLPAVGAAYEIPMPFFLTHAKLYQLNASALVEGPSAYYDVAFNETDIHDVRIVPTDDDDRGVPVWRVTVRYARNYTVMTRSECAGSVSAASVAFATKEWRESIASDATVKTDWPNAAEIVVETPLCFKADADVEAARLLALYKVRRMMLQIDVPLAYWDDAGLALNQTQGPSLIMPGKIAFVTMSRLGLSQGKLFVILYREVNLRSGLMTLTIWG